jgi:hypothetical protein
MEIRSHSENHIVELDDGSRWQIFRAISTSGSAGRRRPNLPSFRSKTTSVRTRGSATTACARKTAGESWPVREVKSALKDG